MNFRQQITLVEGLDITPGIAHRGDCPFCGAGNTFQAENNYGRLRWYCFSASCEAKGDIKTGLTPEGAAAWRGTQEVKSAPFVVPPSWLPLTGTNATPVVERYLSVNNCWNAVATGRILAYEDVAANRIVFAQTDETTGEVLGGIGRKLGEVHKSPGPKWYKYGAADTGYPIYHNGKSPGHSVVVVEDLASSCAISQFTDSFALTGTHISAIMLTQITSRWKNVTIALDKDATLKAAEMVRQLAWYVENVNMMILTEDLKTYHKDDLRYELVKGGAIT
jgi:hypothetical protein